MKRGTFFMDRRREMGKHMYRSTEMGLKPKKVPEPPPAVEL